MEVLRHPLTHQTRFKGGCFRAGTKSYRGMARAMKQRFWPIFHGTRGLGKRAATARAAGAQLDRLVTLLVRKQSLSGCKTATAACKRDAATAINALKRLGWCPIGSQVPVCCPRTRQATAIDILCTNAERETIVVELKNTTMKRAEHVSSYRRPCPTVPRMPNDLPNTEYNHHQMQAGGMVRMLRSPAYKLKRPVRGAVLCVVDGSALVYPMREWATKDETFAVKTTQKATATTPNPKRARFSRKAPAKTKANARGRAVGKARGVAGRRS